MKKVLFCASTVSHIKNFHLPYLRAFEERGWEVWVAAGTAEPVPFAGHVVELPFCKRLMSPRNLLAILRARRLLKREGFDLVSAHTTLAGAVIRAAVLTMRKRPRVAYTCHGYLFSDKGVRKWIYLLPEILCARVTGTLMVMNREDRALARKYHLCRGRLVPIPGMGFDGARFVPLPAAKRLENRREQGFLDSEVLFIYAAEFSKRKNQRLLLEGFAKALPEMPRAKLLLAGNGEELENCRKFAQKLQIENAVHFLGSVADMAALYPLCDAVVSTSRSEGLPFHLMEAMSCGLPAAVSDIKGHRELVDAGKTGFLFPSENGDLLAKALLELYNSPRKRTEYGKAAREKSRGFTLEAAAPKVLAAYGLLEK
ncbi:glycosyltransferase family 1 protein [Anaerotruncus sp. AF02-27]|uniref:glycosyltransferase family 4 protein n=1 Tax=Anaerotruncus sp. AF02-27 TaxID=2292191 RepID=UPI000E4993E2|nr:glycosyltransferase family 4 protein [Anaerotruncus sp. AF02-27]RGX56021.1 glycosyltransferase family 1 protein [Anaerotruncus sp. AF02-27]